MEYTLLLLLCCILLCCGKQPSRTSLFAPNSLSFKRGTSCSAHNILLLRGGAKKKHDSKIKRKKRNKKSKTSIDQADSDILDVDKVEIHEKVDSMDLFSGNSVVQSFLMRTPPITLYYVLSSSVITLLCFLFNKNRWPEFLFFDWKGIFGLQLWKIFTGFLFFGALDIFYPLTMQFVWQNMSQLEKLSYNKPEEFVMMLIFGGGTLIFLYTVFGLSHKLLGHNLATYLAFIWSKAFEGMDVNFMDLFILKSELLPWFFCAQTFLLEHEFPLADILGIAVGHTYHYLNSKQLLPVPSILRNYFQQNVWKERYSRFQDDFE